MKPEVNENDDNEGKEDDGDYTSDSSDSNESGLCDPNEIDELLEQDLPEDFRRCPKRRKLMPQETHAIIKSLAGGNNLSSDAQENIQHSNLESDNLETGDIQAGQTSAATADTEAGEFLDEYKDGDNKEKYKEKVVMILEEKAKSKFDDLPGGWIQVRHISGMPLYLHRKTRVCTLSKPYRLGPGSARRHNMPMSAIPCLAYRKALEKEAEESKTRASGLNCNGDDGSDNKNTMPEDSTNVQSEENGEIMDVDVDNNSMNKQESPLAQNESSQSATQTMMEKAESTTTPTLNGIISLCSNNNNTNDNSENNQIPIVIANSTISIESSSSSPPFPSEENQSLLLVPSSEVHAENQTAMNDKIEEGKNQSHQQQEQNIDKDLHDISDDELEPGEIVDDDVPDVLDCSGSLDKQQLSNEGRQKLSDSLNFTDDNELLASTFRGTSNEFQIPGCDKSKTKCPKGRCSSSNKCGQKSQESSTLLAKKSLSTIIIASTAATTNGTTENNLTEAAKNLIPKAQVETAEEALATNSVTPEDLRQYCMSLFKFKKVKCKKFKSWSDRRKHTKEEKKRLFQRPTLPDGVQLITFPVQRSGDESGKGCKEYTMNPQGKSSVCILHEYVQHALRMQPSYDFKETQNAANPYAATVMINNINYGTGYGSSKKIAKAAAARATLEILIPKMKDVLKSNGSTSSDSYHIGYFDQIEMDDPRITKMCASVSEPSPYALLLTCLQRNFGKEGTSDIKFEMIATGNQVNRFRMETGPHSVEVTASNKRDGKQLASQALLCKIHPHIKNFGSFLRLYGNGSIKSVKEKKQEEQQITTLQSKASVNSPNYAILNKLREEMLKLRNSQQFKNATVKVESNESATESLDSV